jgi:hypothetical protein
MDGIILITFDLAELAADMSCTIRLSVELIDENGRHLADWYTHRFQTGSISSVLTALDSFENQYQIWGNYCRYGEVPFRAGLNVPTNQSHNYSTDQEGILRGECFAQFNEVTSTLTQWLDRTINSDFICSLIRRKVSDLGSNNLLVRLAFQTQVNKLQSLHWEKCHQSQFFQQLRNLKRFDLATNSSINTLLSSRVPQTIRVAWAYPLNVLVVVGDNQGLDTDVDLQSIEESLGFNPTILRHPSIIELTELLSDKPWNIVIYLGHTSTCVNGDDIEIRLDNNSTSNSLSVDDLRNILIASINNGLQVFVFISCEGTGFVRQLYRVLEEEQIRLPYVVVMRRTIGDSIANAFTRRFARFFFQDRYSIEESVTRANAFMRTYQRQFPGAECLATLWGDNKAPYLVVPSQPSLEQPSNSPPDTSESTETIASSQVLIATTEIVPPTLDMSGPTKTVVPSQVPNLWKRIWKWLFVDRV